jgi:cardiolipin synthase
MQDKVLTLPNLVTLCRILLVPVLVSQLLQEHFVTGFLIFLVSASSDHLDGWLARRLNQISRLGSLMDPVADKLLVLMVIPVLWHTGFLAFFYVALVVVRYLSQLSVFPVLHFVVKRHFRSRPRLLPKLATVIAFIIIGLALFSLAFAPWLEGHPWLDRHLYFLRQILMVVGAVLETYVLLTFLPRYAQIIRGEHDTFE